MSIDDLEAEILKLTPEARARLAGKLLESLDRLSDAETMEIWAREAERRDAALSAAAGPSRAAADVFREARRKRT